MRPIALFLLVLPACYVGPTYKIKPNKQSCASPLVEREYDLALKVDNGPGDGSFDYPMLDWPLVAATRGNYDLKSGAFSWTNDYAADAVRVTETAQGTGSIKVNGDLDLQYTLTVDFKDQTQAAYSVRHTRTACAETLRRENVDDADDVELTDLTWSGGGADWTRNFVEGPVAVQGLGRMEADRSWVETVDFADGGVQVLWTTEGDGNGHRTRTFDDDNGLAKTIGSWERWYDGTVAMEFTYNRPDIIRQTWEFSVDAIGDGGGTWFTSDDECEISFNEGKCRLKNCTSETLEGRCTVPVTWPEF